MRRTEYIDIDALVFAPDNPKTHIPAGIAASQSRFGIIDLAVVDERTGRLVAGHGRIETLRAEHAAGHQPPDGIRVEGDHWLVPVNRGWSSADDAEAAAAAIALNAYVEAGGWDRAGLAALLDDLAESPIGLVGMGYDDADIEALAATLPPLDLDEPDATPSADEEGAVRRHGQVRTMVLDYPADEYRLVVARADVARRRRGLPGNAELFAALVTEWQAAQP